LALSVSLWNSNNAQQAALFHLRVGVVAGQHCQPQNQRRTRAIRIFIPYWVGFYGDEHNLNLTVLNAVRRTVEGSKARRLVKSWLSERDSHCELNLAV